MLLTHASQTHGFSAPMPLRLVARHGAIGVDVFFVISGFLITLLLLREREKTGTVSLRGFYRRRALRILPAYCAFVILIVFLSAGGELRIAPQEWAALLSYTMNYLHHPEWTVGHVWSLSIEEQFYLTWPAIVLLACPRRCRSVLVAYLAAAPVLRLGVWAFARGYLPMTDLWTPTRMDSIAAGCLLALLAQEPGFRGLSCFDRKSAGRTAFLVGVVLVASVVLSDRALFAVLFGYSLKAGAIAVLLWLAVVHSTSPVGKLLNLRPLQAVGVLSYSLYLWQQPFLNPHGGWWLCRWPANLLAAVTVASLSYLCVESPFLRLKQQVAS